MLNLEISDIKKVLSHYHDDFSDVTISPLGNGHINSTYKLATSCSEYVLQKINHNVFSKVIELIHNTQKINAFLLQQKKAGNYPFLIPQQHLTKSGTPCIKVNNSYWRLMDFVEGSHTIEAVTSSKQAAHVARAFAQFSLALASFNAQELDVIIDDFHDINFRIRQLKSAVTSNSQARLINCRELVDFCFEQTTFIECVNSLSQRLPLRVTHNDTKINNLLFSTDNNPCAVIDLDTCMPGLLMHDFGDMVRTCCSNLAEDDANIDEMVLNHDIFSALIQEYQKVLTPELTKLEKESLMLGAKLLPFLVGIRFLTDYLDGDKYFQTNREKHNLDRATNQFKLFTLLCKAEPELRLLASLAN